MARQKVEDHLLYLVFRLIPTWATVATIIAFYVALRYLLPLFTHNNLWAQMGAAYAPWLTFLLALFALYAEADKYKRRQLLKQQSSLGTLQSMTWLEFEHLVGEVYRRQGYKVEEAGGKGPDGGVDIVLRRSGETVLVQCKQWKTQSVGVKPLREFAWVVTREKATRGIFVTCGGYTSAVLSEFASQPIDLVDGPKLLKLAQEVQANPVQPQQTPSAQVTVLPVDAAQPANEAAEPACPKCGSAMRRKTAHQGPNAGNDFWGCSAFPRCRGTRPL